MLSVSFFSDRTSPRTFSFILDLNYSSSKYPENHNLTTLSCLVDEHFALLPISLLEYWYESSNELVNKKKKKRGSKKLWRKKKDPYLTRLGHRNWKWYLMPETDANSFDFQLTRRRKEKKMAAVVIKLKLRCVFFVLFFFFLAVAHKGHLRTARKCFRDLMIFSSLLGECSDSEMLSDFAENRISL